MSGSVHDAGEARQRYLLALGSNRTHHRFGTPRRVLEHALGKIEQELGVLVAVSPLIETPPIGPSRRRYINAAAILETDRMPPQVIATLLAIEARFGRRRQGQAWQSRVLDLDIVLWSSGPFALDDGETCLVLPHPAYRQRDFVLGPARTIAGNWRDPLTGLTIRQQFARLTKPRHALR
ncbi:2-amino-4-hydroxy-6-hydroxymethyldihydropteridine diphosphokinase [Novosphingobium profundi]|uniref:2-amino-4-hydroxy-6- hydroxymethyldihydropteridine diphosphokinase n=1 Tax=Novosphingobium profundi TaxID=1774954 RepID=UPI001BDAAD43|nr:2-amino-4-hydroxy-6-hydroxymethyldihydropteridine diphosphokinase [Novosphingobium profundi]MBT0667289.1 2-amino-4-hydroxy-6-hydroxymethyldihydropteridine diphosphokinase [Novosphingobium profundi]